MQQTMDTLDIMDQHHRRGNGYILEQSRTFRHLDDGTGTCMEPQKNMGPSDIGDSRTDIGDGASDRTTSGSMQSNIHGGEISDRDLV